MNWKIIVMAVTKVKMLGLMLMNEDTESFTTIEESAPSKKCKKEQAAVKQVGVTEKSKSGRNHGAELDVMIDMSKVLNKRLASMYDEKQDNEDYLFGKPVAAELKSLPQRQK